MTHTDAPSVITIYADGAASPNPGKGGYGVVLLRGGQRRELSGGFRLTTNNRMEILGVIAGLRAVDGRAANVTLYSDSRYVVDMFTGGHARAWRSHGWTRNRGKERALNPDLWGELLALTERPGHAVKMVWVKGHASNVENARCDELAVLARQEPDLPADEGYEQPAPPAAAQLHQLSLDLVGNGLGNG